MIDPGSLDLAGLYTNWLGQPANPIRKSDSEQHWLPEPYKGWHDLRSRWRLPFSGIQKIRNPETVIRENGYAIFMEDSSGDHIWAFRVDDPLKVYERDLSDSSWYESPERAVQFVKHVSILDLIFTSENHSYARNIEADLISNIFAVAEEIDFGKWRTPLPGHKIFMCEDAFALTVETRTAGLQVHIAGRTKPALQRLESLNVPWKKPRTSR